MAKMYLLLSLLRYCITLKNLFRAGEMTELEKALAPKPGDVSSIWDYPSFISVTMMKYSDSNLGEKELFSLTKF